MEYQTKREIVIAAAVGVVSFGAGAAVGYFFCARQKKAEIHDLYKANKILDNALDQAQLDYETHLEDCPTAKLYEGPVQFVEEEDEQDLPFVDPDQEVLPLEEDEQPIIQDIVHERHSVFPATVDGDADWDYAVEMRARELSPDTPYVIHVDEFNDNELEFTQSTLTYYEGDDILTDEHDVPVYNYKTLVGEISFGKGSGDPNVFYVRNPKIEAEYEILRDRGHYAVEVLGVEIEEHFEHQDKRRVPKFRPVD